MYANFGMLERFVAVAKHHFIILSINIVILTTKVERWWMVIKFIQAKNELIGWFDDTRVFYRLFVLRNETANKMYYVSFNKDQLIHRNKNQLTFFWHIIDHVYWWHQSMLESKQWRILKRLSSS